MRFILAAGLSSLAFLWLVYLLSCLAFVGRRGVPRRMDVARIEARNRIRESKPMRPLWFDEL